LHVDDVAERAKRQIGRPSTVQNFRKEVVGILQEEPDLATLEILRRAREIGYQGGKSALYALVASLRPKSAKPLVRFEGLPGEFSQHDFGQVKVEFLNGSCRLFRRAQVIFSQACIIDYGVFAKPGGRAAAPSRIFVQAIILYLLACPIFLHSVETTHGKGGGFFLQNRNDVPPFHTQRAL
jgi:hypothetical protein